MAEIATYQCTNNLCRYSVHVSHEFPIWHSQTPKKLRSIAVDAHARPYVIGRRNESLCHHCKRVVELKDEALCPTCKNQLHKEQLGKRCPNCKKGTLSMPELAVY